MLKLSGAVTCVKFLTKSAGPGSGSAQGFLPYVELSILLFHIFPHFSHFSTYFRTFPHFATFFQVSSACLLLHWCLCCMAALARSGHAAFGPCLGLDDCLARDVPECSCLQPHFMFLTSCLLVTRVTRACMGSLWNSSHPNAVFCTCCTILRCVMLRTTCCEADGEVTWQFPWNLWLPLGCAAWMLQEYSALEGTWKTFSSYGLPRAPHHFSKKAAEWSTATRMEYDIYWHIISLLKHDSKTGFHLSTFLLAPKKIPQSRYSSMVPLLALLSHSFMQQK